MLSDSPSHVCIQYILDEHNCKRVTRLNLRLLKMFDELKLELPPYMLQPTNWASVHVDVAAKERSSLLERDFEHSHFCRNSL